MQRICVFAGAHVGYDPIYAQTAQLLARLLVQHRIKLVYGGGNIGLMGILADTLLAEGGEVIGVIPAFLQAQEVAHTRLTQLHIVHTMHERKALMLQLADGFIALAGGFGTLDELFEMLTWRQLQLHSKPTALINTHAYYTPLLQFLQQTNQRGFLNATHLAYLQVAETPEDLFTKWGLLNRRQKI